MHRPTVGVIALVLLIVGAAGLAWPSSGANPAQFAPAFIRVGAVLGAFWLALPQTRQWQNKLLLGAIALTALVIAIWPRILPVLAGFMLVFALLRSRLQAHRPKLPERRRDGKA
ncbi:MAG TPA: hypothetical protein VGX78_22755 [Pirellulales bacterium]|jgi:hypothetical protein|nr:hypothetical protein [Pirellulales bacterium]